MNLPLVLLTSLITLWGEKEDHSNKLEATLDAWVS